MSATMRLHHDQKGRLVLTLPEGEPHVGVAPVRCFPFTDPAGFVAFLDEHGREVHLLPDPSQLPAEMRALLDQELARREFLPTITRIHSVSAGAEPTTWHVATDRGETRFVLPSEDNIRRLGADAAIVTDEHGVRYRIAGLKALDKHSRKLLQRYL